VTDHPAYAIIHVKETPTCDAWPIVERVPDGWQSGVHHYDDEDVLDLTPLHLFPEPATVHWGLQASDGVVIGCHETTAATLCPDGSIPVSRLVGSWTPATPQPPETT
jgi:hypothetical protein